MTFNTPYLFVVEADVNDGDILTKVSEINDSNKVSKIMNLLIKIQEDTLNFKDGKGIPFSEDNIHKYLKKGILTEKEIQLLRSIIPDNNIFGDVHTIVSIVGYQIDGKDTWI